MEGEIKNSIVDENTVFPSPEELTCPPVSELRAVLPVQTLYINNTELY